jgi:hypothetical protein
VEVDADLIVLKTHGRHGFAHLVLGSVAEEVVRSAPCAVLTLTPTAQQKAAHLKMDGVKTWRAESARALSTSDSLRLPVMIRATSESEWYDRIFIRSRLARGSGSVP